MNSYDFPVVCVCVCVCAHAHALSYSVVSDSLLPQEL